MVIGVSKQPSIRRTFEDEFVTQLKVAGVEAVPSYLYIPEDGQVEENRLQACRTPEATQVDSEAYQRCQLKDQIYEQLKAAAAQARGLPPNVPPRPPGPTESTTSLRPVTAASGSPPPSDLPETRRSGSTP